MFVLFCFDFHCFYSVKQKRNRHRKQKNNFRFMLKMTETAVGDIPACPAAWFLSAILVANGLSSMGWTSIDPPSLWTLKTPKNISTTRKGKLAGLPGSRPCHPLPSPPVVHCAGRWGGIPRKSEKYKDDKWAKWWDDNYCRPNHLFLL